MSRVEADALASASGSRQLHGQKISWWRLFEVGSLPVLPPDQSTALALLNRAVIKHQFGTAATTLVGHVAPVMDARTALGYLRWRWEDSRSQKLYAEPDFLAYLAWKTSRVVGSVE